MKLTTMEKSRSTPEAIVARFKAIQDAPSDTPVYVSLPQFESAMGVLNPEKADPRDSESSTEFLQRIGCTCELKYAKARRLDR